MRKLVEDNLQILPKVGDDIKGKVLANERNSLYIDLSPFGTGLIFGREYLIVKDLIKNTTPGVEITAKILDLEGENGYIELSLKEAKAAESWQQAQNYMKDKTVLSLPIREANRGGLVIIWQGLTGFLPVSQLKSENYPKVVGGDKNLILTELEKFVNTKMAVNIISADPTENKLIFSEKTVAGEPINIDSEEKKTKSADAHHTEKKEDQNMIEKYSIGDVVSAEITGIADFGIFVKLPKGDDGLIHISELSWSLIGDLRTLYKEGDEVTAKIIELNKDKISLSIKALTENPWRTVKNKYKKGDKVNAVVIKISEHGALVSVAEGIYGLIHISEFENYDDLNDKLKLGNTYKFKINVFDVDFEKMTLKLAE